MLAVSIQTGRQPSTSAAAPPTDTNLVGIAGSSAEDRPHEDETFATELESLLLQAGTPRLMDEANPPAIELEQSASPAAGRALAQTGVAVDSPADIAGSLASSDVWKTVFQPAAGGDTTSGELLVNRELSIEFAAPHLANVQAAANGVEPPEVLLTEQRGTPGEAAMERPISAVDSVVSPGSVRPVSPLPIAHASADIGGGAPVQAELAASSDQQPTPEERAGEHTDNGVARPVDFTEQHRQPPRELVRADDVLSVRGQPDLSTTLLTSPDVAAQADMVASGKPESVATAHVSGGPAQASAPGMAALTSPERQLTDHLLSARQSMQHGKASLEVTLDPPELGKLTIELTESDDRLTAKLMVAEAATLDSIKRSLPTMMHLLAEAGVSLNDLQLSSFQRQGGSPDDRADASTFGRTGNAGRQQHEEATLPSAASSAWSRVNILA